MINGNDTENEINMRKLYHVSGDLKFIPLFAQKGGRNMKELHYSPDSQTLVVINTN